MKVIILTITRDNGNMITYDTKKQNKNTEFIIMIKLLCSFEIPA